LHERDYKWLTHEDWVYVFFWLCGNLSHTTTPDIIVALRRMCAIIVKPKQKIWWGGSGVGHEKGKENKAQSKSRLGLQT